MTRNTMKQRVVKKWLARERSERRTDSLTTDGTNLYSYNACIGVVRDDGTIVLNGHKYTRTTTQHQGEAYAQAYRSGHPCVSVDVDGWAARPADLVKATMR